MQMRQTNWSIGVPLVALVVVLLFVAPVTAAEGVSADEIKRIDPMYADADPLDRPPSLVDDLHASVIATYFYGSAKGNLQTPAGGKRGTTSANRPTFKDVGIDTANIGDVEARLGLGPAQEVFVGAQFIRLGGDARLSRQLISQGMTFPASTAVSSTVRMDWYRVGYRYSFVLDETDKGVSTLLLTPLADVLFWDFDYELTGGSRNVSRSYVKVGAQLGLELTWRPNGGNFWIDAGAASFPQIRSVPNVSTEHITLHYRFYRGRHFDMTGSLGFAAEQQAFKDDQKLPNHQSADFGPLLQVGLQVDF